MTKKLLRVVVETEITLPEFKREIDNQFIDNNIKIKELKMSRSVKNCINFVAIIENSQKPNKIKNILNKMGKIKTYYLVSGTSVKKAKLKNKINKTRKSKKN